MGEGAIRTVVLDFDGAICPSDVTEALLIEFGDPSWWEVELEMRGRTATLRDALVRQAALLRGDPDTWLNYAVSTFALEPTFAPFVKWADDQGVTLAIASDGLGFYIEPMLMAAGIEGVAVHTNAFDPDTRILGFPSANEICVGCGTCKMNVVVGYRRQFGPTAFVGEGYSDRYGALFADATFAKRHLATLCDETGITFEPWQDYDDVRRGLEVWEPPPPGTSRGAVRCPGWTEPTPPSTRVSAST
jgi:2-hydroxy-3-keto-5-methylthiopentenyl-1-phosphate phosphatase